MSGCRQLARAGRGVPPSSWPPGPGRAPLEFVNGLVDDLDRIFHGHDVDLTDHVDPVDDAAASIRGRYQDLVLSGDVLLVGVAADSGGVRPLGPALSSGSRGDVLTTGRCTTVMCAISRPGTIT